MDGQDYLNQISQNTKPAKKTKGLSSFFSSKLFLFISISLIALVILIIIGAVLNGGKKDEKNLSYSLHLRLDNTSSLIKEYQESIRSSTLRGSSASLYSVLYDTDKKLTDYLTNKYKFKENSIDKKMVEEANLEKEALNNELFEAKINGILDRVFAHKMAYETSLFITQENSLSDATKSKELKEALNTSKESLSQLYDQFNNFSETK